MEKSATKIIFQRLIGIFIFLLFLGSINFISKYITFSSFLSFTSFFNRYALLLIGVGISFMFGELLSKMEFPSNLFGPLVNFVGAWFLLYFVFEFLEAFNRRFNFDFLNSIFILKDVIFFTILSLIFVFGYLPILYKILKDYNKENNIKEPLKIIKEVRFFPKKTNKKIKKGRKKK